MDVCPPRGFGLAWNDPCRCSSIFVPIPFNWPVSIIRGLWLRVKYGPKVFVKARWDHIDGERMVEQNERLTDQVWRLQAEKSKLLGKIHNAHACLLAGTPMPARQYLCEAMGIDGPCYNGITQKSEPTPAHADA